MDLVRYLEGKRINKCPLAKNQLLVANRGGLSNFVGTGSELKELSHVSLLLLSGYSFIANCLPFFYAGLHSVSCVQWNNRVTQRIVSVNYLFGRPLIPYDFLKGIFTSNFRAIGNLRPSVFGLVKMSFRVPKKGRLRFSERK